MAATAVAWQCIRSRDDAAAKRGEAEARIGEAAERLTIEIAHHEAGSGRRERTRPTDGRVCHNAAGGAREAAFG